jgi:outer membrane protein OmpA-like peptidoglycan-associated protein
MKFRIFLVVFIFLCVLTGFAGNIFPVVELSFQESPSNEIYFSPNFDGSQDTVGFLIKLRKQIKVQSWELVVFNASGETVKKFSPDMRDATNFADFLNSFTTQKRAIDLPHSIEWNGLSERRRLLPEGQYFAFVKIKDEYGAEFVSLTNKITLDITPPSGDLALSDSLFSPEGQRQTIQIGQNLSKDSFWRADLRKANGEVVLSWDWKENPPVEWMWDGRDKNQTLLPEGAYDYILYGEDLAGNRAILPVKGIYLSLKKYSLFLNVEKKSFSTNEKASNRAVVITPVFSDTNGLLSWTLFIYDEKKDLVWEMEGKEVFSRFIWDGRNNEGNFCRSGFYQARLKALYEDGMEVESVDAPIIIDNEVPEAGVSYQSLPFSPDGDGARDSLSILIQAKDLSGIRKWKLAIFDPDQRPFKSFYGEGIPPEKINWNGRSDNGELVESSHDYPAQLSVEDNAGNEAKSKALPIKIDVLVEKTALGLKIRINNIEFDFDKALIKPVDYPILNRVAEILKKYKKYSVQIQGHTDSIGREKVNLKLSEKRALSVYQYLLKAGIPQKRMKYAGYGFRYPLADNSTKEGQRKNRRVEFLLVK